MPTITAILRFNDYERVDTIAEHSQMIVEHRRVWWAWWKKRFEPYPEQALQDLVGRCPITIGLAHRGVELFYKAQCSRLVIHGENEVGPSPEPPYTPAYYRASDHVAWFELTSIEPISKDSFVNRFGSVPLGDPTLFIVQLDDGRLATDVNYVAPVPPFQRVHGDAILHLSDLHFGTDHEYVVQPTSDSVERPDLLALVRNSLATTKVGILVVSGDLTSRGQSDGYVWAGRFLEDLIKELKVDRKHVVIVPGNHDFWIQETEYPTRGHEYELPFRRFLQGFYRQDITDLQGVVRFETPSGWKISVVYLNSSRLRTQDTKEYGYVGKEQYRPLLKSIADANGGRTAFELAAARVLNIAVLHHHVLPGALVCDPERKRPVSLTLDAGALVTDLQAAGIHCVLHGHQHVPFVGSTARVSGQSRGWKWNPDPLHVLGLGSTGAKADRLTDEMRHNTVGLYQPTEKSLSVRMFEFTSGVEPRCFIDFELPLGHES